VGVANFLFNNVNNLLKKLLILHEGFYLMDFQLAKLLAA